jgi:hypothetical protein
MELVFGPVSGLFPFLFASDDGDKDDQEFDVPDAIPLTVTPRKKHAGKGDEEDEADPLLGDTGGYPPAKEGGEEVDDEMQEQIEQL